jgi:predicted MFS family arabinose efflux permease
MSSIAIPRLRNLAAPLLLLIAAGCVLAAVTNGIRTSFGLFTLPITGDLGLSRGTWGMAMAIQNLAWGIAQPIAGGLADRYGSAKVIVGGLLIYAAGLLLMLVSPNGTLLNLSAGVMTGIGIAASSFSTIMIAFGKRVPQEKRSLIFGIATAASSLGQCVFAPLGQGFISAFGWRDALLYLAVILVVSLPLTYALRDQPSASIVRNTMTFRQALRGALNFGSYRLLVLGFFVCGFHLAFINVHLPAYLVQCGFPAEVGGWSIAVIGLCNIAGTLAAGYLGGKMPKQILLAAIYFVRAVAIALFVFLPVNEFTVYGFSSLIGLLWLSTVPLTAGLVTSFFGPRYMGMLYGVAFLSHQLGSFVGVWFGGYVFDQTGSYDLMWYLGILLGLLATAVHLSIDERSDARFQPVAA